MANNQLLASDNFASGSLAAGWSAAFGLSECQVVGSGPYYTEPNTLSTSAGQVWTALGVLVNQISEVTVGTLTKEGGTYLNLRVRWQLTSSSGYEIEIVDGDALLYRWDSGSATQLGSTVTGLTFAAGDIWTMCADGASISVYQNGKQIIYHLDATYASGYPGYVQYSTVNIAHNQVASWNGYNCVQQNGVWQKQGVIIPAIAADLASSGFGTANNSQVLYEGNAQILSGNVFKMWFGTTEGICYAESADGKSWTRYSSNPVIASGFSLGIIKNGTTYYGYLSTGTVAKAYTSTDGLSWTLQNATAISEGAGGSWDASGIYYMFPVTISGGTWYALYTGVNSSGVSKIGLATSTDGIHWTKYASNPVLASSPWQTWTSYAAAEVAGTWYLWCQGSQPGQPSSQTGDPTDVIRYSSPDLINWIKSSNPAPWHAQLSETVNGLYGQCVPNSIIQVGNQTYLYTTSSTEDGTPSAYQISLAIAPAPLSSLVLFGEDGTTQIATDAFASGTGNLSANWTTQTGLDAPQIVAGPYVEAKNITTNAGACYTGATISANQYSECTDHALIVGAYLNPCVRMATGSKTRYEADINGPLGSRNSSIAVYRFVSGTAVQIGPTISCTPAVGDVFRLSAFTKTDDGTVVLSLFQNGFLIYQAQDYSSSALLVGYPGFTQYVTTALTNSQMSLWAGGNANVIPNYPPATGGSMLGVSLNSAWRRGGR